MAIAPTLQSYLGDHQIAYEIKHHDRTSNSTETAQVSHVPGQRLAKGVVLRSGTGYMLAVLPSTKHVALDEIEALTGSPVELASEEEASRLFPDCDRGAVPVFGEAYGIPSIIDEDLDLSRDIYCEGGDHRCLVHMDGRDFGSLMAGAERAHFAA